MLKRTCDLPASSSSLYRRGLRALGLLLCGLGYGTIVIACSVTVPRRDGLTLLCDEAPETCPTESEAAIMLETFAAFEPRLDARDPIAWHWYDPEAEFWAFEDADGVTHHVKAYAPDPQTLHVSACSFVPHELMHVALWRSTGDPGRKHAPPVWLEDDTETTRAVRVALSEQGICP